MHTQIKRNLPYAKAHYYLIALLGITLLAFWDSYFGVLKEASLAHHLHGITATTWIVLMALQSFLIHRGQCSLHRIFGMSLFLIVPLMTAAFTMVIQLGVQKTLAQHPFYMLFGEALLTIDVLLLLTVPLQVYLALRFRRRVRLHSALMLGTVIGVMPPITSRLLSGYVPGFIIDGPESLHLFKYALLWGNVISLVIALILYFCYKREGWPWMLAAVISALNYGLYATVGKTDWWHCVVESFAWLTPLQAFGFGLLFGLMACLLGWRHGQFKKSVKPVSPVQVV
ncbi:MAG: hypothetical protein ACK5L8_01370 [Marinicella pacifica]